MIRDRIARCPAKVNLALRVLARRDDGFHELDTVFQAIDLWDELRLRPGKGFSLTCSDPSLSGDDNLVLRAARAAHARWGRPAPGVDFHLVKRIPHGAGLGGGSSDAAAALLLCAAHWGRGARREELAEIGGELGADVPFFLTGGTARGRGRGDRIEPLPFLGPAEFLLGFPRFGTSTAEVFAALEGRLTLPGNGVNLPPLFGHKCPEDNDFGFVGNDLEGVVFERWPELERFRDALVECGARWAQLSGSGSTVYGYFEDRARLDNAYGRLQPRFTGWELRRSAAVDGGARIVPCVA